MKAVIGISTSLTLDPKLLKYLTEFVGFELISSHQIAAYAGYCHRDIAVDNRTHCYGHQYSDFSGLILSSADYQHFLQQPEPPTYLPLLGESSLLQESLWHHFLLRVLILRELNLLGQCNLTRGTLMDFHSRYKLLLLAHSQPDYRTLGPFVASMDSFLLETFLKQYRQRLMMLLRNMPTRENHTNVLFHIQGYFRKHVSVTKRQRLTQAIYDYHNEKAPLAVPIEFILTYLLEYPNPYLLQQRYFNFYPQIQNAIAN